MRLHDYVVMSCALALLVTFQVSAQSQFKIPDSQQPPTSMRYVSPSEYLARGSAVSNSPATPAPHAKQANFGDAVMVGTMINAYTSQGMFTTQLGYDWENKIIVTLYRAGPEQEYPNAGNGSLVLNVSTDGGYTWSGNSPIFNEDLPGNIQGQELAARHPSIFAFPSETGTSVSTVWGNIQATFLNPVGILGEIAYKAGALGGPYTGGRLDQSAVMQYYPARIVSDRNGTLFSFFQSIDPDTDMLTGEYFLMKSTDLGRTWAINYNNPILRDSDLEHNYETYYYTSKLDVSPDGSTLYLAFIGIFVENGMFTFTDNRLGYVRSTDGGATWSQPYMYPLYTFDFGANRINTIDGWLLPSIGVAVDGLNQPHFLMSVNGRDTFYPLDSTLVGEITVNPEDPTEPPKFFKLAENLLPDYRRMVNPRDATTGPQPVFSIWGEHDWCKAPDGMHLIAKWIDADSLFSTTPDTHPYPFVRDSTHDVYICEKDIYSAGNAYQGWETKTAQGNEVLRIVNVTETPGVDEKFSRISPFYDPLSGKTYFLYTIMGTGEFVPGQRYPDTDDLAPAELWIVPTPVNIVQPQGTEHPPAAAFMTLEQNYPNPVRTSTDIRFILERAMSVRITVSDLLGRNVATLTDGFRDAGSHSVQFTAGDLPAGQYIYRMEAGGQTVTKMMNVLK